MVLLGVLFCLALLEGGLRLLGTELQTAQRRANLETRGDDEAIRVMCVGESTTAMGGKNSYPAQLEEVLGERSMGRRFRVINVGVGGADSSLLLSRLPDDLALYRPHVVVAMMGFNDTVGSSAPDQPRWDRAVPDIGGTLRDRSGFPYTLKTYRLAELLWFSVARERSRAGDPVEDMPELPPDAAEGDHFLNPELPAWVVTGPDHYYTAESRPPDIEAAWDLAAEGEVDGADAAFRRATREGSAPVLAWIEWGQLLEQSGRLEEAEEAFLQAVELDPAAGFAHFGLARVQVARGDCAAAQALFDRAARLDPRCGHGFVTAGLCHLDQGDQVRAQDAFAWALKYKRALAPLLADPAEVEAHEYFYRVEGRQGGIWDLLALPEGKNPHDPAGHVPRIDLLEAQGEHDTLDDLAKEMEWGAVAPCAAMRLAQYYRRQGQQERATTFLFLARHAQQAAVGPMTRDSYEQLQSLVEQQGIQLIVAQYANRPVQPLRDLLEWNDDVAFVDNEAVFREALEEHTYDELFWDHCYGNLGHATRLGNRILAENIARTVLQVVDTRSADVSPAARPGPRGVASSRSCRPRDTGRRP